MCDVFPMELGSELGGRRFEEVFQTMPKIIEFVDSSWEDNCTGVFRLFYEFVKRRLKNPLVRAQHNNRCREYVKGKNTKKLPRYLLKYATH